MNPGIGDSDALAEDWKVGVMVSDFSEKEYGKAANVIAKMVRDPAIKTETRLVAEKLFDLRKVGAERYSGLYERVLESK
jgi:hypothetical protein